MSFLATTINPNIWLRPLAPLLRPNTSVRYTSRLRKISTPPFPVIERCPDPTCASAPMPSGLDINHERPLNGTMAAYSQQVLVCTGKDNWASRIENDEESGDLARGLKRLLGPGGKFSDPYRNIMLTHSSFSPSPTTSSEASTPDPVLPETTASAYLLPSFTYLPSIPLNLSSLEAFTCGFLLLPQSLRSGHSTSPSAKQPPTRNSSIQLNISHIHPTTDILILICGHLARDNRCGVLGPLLREEFTRVLSSKSQYTVLTKPPTVPSPVSKGSNPKPPAQQGVRIGLISHIGGHVFAGNIIIYIPPSMSDRNGLSGKGIWYGRVEPRHVEGIVSETLGRGKVIGELFRGGIRSNGEILSM